MKFIKINVLPKFKNIKILLNDNKTYLSFKHNKK